jgi:hypothetical protein
LNFVSKFIPKREGVKRERERERWRERERGREREREKDRERERELYSSVWWSSFWIVPYSSQMGLCKMYVQYLESTCITQVSLPNQGLVLPKKYPEKLSEFLLKFLDC